MPADSYLLGMSPAEIDRLRRQHETWRGPTEAAWRMGGFDAGQTVVDLGSGPGFTTIGLARVVGPSGRVIAVDASTTASEWLRERARQEGLANVDVHTADVAACDVGAWKPNAVFARWLFSFLADPAAVIRRIAAGLEPGGVLVVMDYWNYRAIRTEPASPLFERVFESVYASFADAGGSLDVAGAVPAYCSAAGLAVRRIEPVCHLGRPGSPVWEWLSDFLTLYFPTLVKGGYLTRDDVEEYNGWWRKQSENPGAFVFAPPVLSVAAERIHPREPRYS
jgi:ubiquinone/menaquinone biosynthesis C-methylase UbiE